MSKQKFYVVWNGRQPGIYTTWKECNAQVWGYPKAKYKSYATRAEAEFAYGNQYAKRNRPAPITKRLERYGKPTPYAFCVDAACNSIGTMEYRGLYILTKQEIFRRGPYCGGTNNIGEFLAIGEALMYLKDRGINKPLYSDSQTAMAWIRRKRCNTKLRKTKSNQEIFNLIMIVENWFKENHFDNKILKWHTSSWGEIPADYGRK